MRLLSLFILTLTLTHSFSQNMLGQTKRYIIKTQGTDCNIPGKRGTFLTMECDGAFRYYIFEKETGRCYQMGVDIPLTEKETFINDMITKGYRYTGTKETWSAIRDGHAPGPRVTAATYTNDTFLYTIYDSNLHGNPGVHFGINIEYTELNP